MCSQLLRYPFVVFAGYIVAHPLDQFMSIRIQTDGTVTPRQAFEQALIDLVGETRRLRDEFDVRSRRAYFSLLCVPI